MITITSMNNFQNTSANFLQTFQYVNHQQINDGANTSKGAPAFIYPLLLEYQQDYPDIDIYLGGDSGFADVMFYEKLESNGVFYKIFHDCYNTYS